MSPYQVHNFSQNHFLLSLCRTARLLWPSSSELYLVGTVCPRKDNLSWNLFLLVRRPCFLVACFDSELILPMSDRTDQVECSVREKMHTLGF